jgi:plasmid stability protein
MATLYVENFPDDIYQALRDRARKNRSSIAAEVIALMKEYVPTAGELRRRREWIRQVKKLRPLRPTSPGPFPSTEEMLREDRER